MVDKCINNPRDSENTWHMEVHNGVHKYIVTFPTTWVKIAKCRALPPTIAQTLVRKCRKDVLV